jgi:hypothetical protein
MSQYYNKPPTCEAASFLPKEVKKVDGKILILCGQYNVDHIDRLYVRSKRTDASKRRVSSRNKTTSTITTASAATTAAAAKNIKWSH